MTNINIVKTPSSKLWFYTINCGILTLMENKSLDIKSFKWADPKIEKFLVFVQDECLKNNIKLYLKDQGEVSINNIQCNGYFSEELNELSFWIDNVDMAWVPIAIHEFSHMRQYVYKPDFWNDVVGDRYDSAYLIDSWLNGTNYPKIRVKAFIDNVIRLEYDCEKITVDLIEKFELHHIVSPKEYIKKSNAYVLFYHTVRRRRKFYELTKEPYSISEVWEPMSDTFFNDPTNEEECAEALKVLNRYYPK